MIAALPKAPSRINPISNPEAATTRRNYILGRMYRLAYIDEEAYETAINEVDAARRHKVQAEVHAPYVAEMVRNEVIGRYGLAAYSAGFEVVTTIDASKQAAADLALNTALRAYSHRHGYRGPEAHASLDEFDSETLPKLAKPCRSCWPSIHRSVG